MPQHIPQGVPLNAYLVRRDGRWTIELKGTCPAAKRAIDDMLNDFGFYADHLPLLVLSTIWTEHGPDSTGAGFVVTRGPDVLATADVLNQLESWQPDSEKK